MIFTITNAQHFYGKILEIYSKKPWLFVNFIVLYNVCQRKTILCLHFN